MRKAAEVKCAVMPSQSFNSAMPIPMPHRYLVQLPSQVLSLRQVQVHRSQALVIKKQLRMAHRICTFPTLKDTIGYLWLSAYQCEAQKGPL